MNKMDFNEDEKELMDYLYVIWKRKWFIIIPTFFLVVIVGIYSFLAPEVWEIDAIIEPGKLFFETAQGQFEEVVVVDPSQLESQINEASYNNLIAAKLNIALNLFPELKAEHIRDTYLVRITLREKDVEKGKAILNSLYNHLKINLDKKIKVETKGLDIKIKNKKNTIKSKNLDIKNKENLIKLENLKIEEKKNEIKTKKNRIKDKENLIRIRKNTIKSKNLNIESKEIEKKRIEEEIITFENKIGISEEREEAITEEMREVKDRINKIEDEQKKVLKKASKKNALAILLYSNEIQNNFRYYNTLDEKLSNEKITQENMNLSIEKKKEEIKQSDNKIELIKTEIEDIHTEIDNIKTKIEDIHTEIDNIGNEIEKINNQINSINYKIDTIKNEIESVKNDILFLEERKARLDFTQLIKKPTSSLYPVSPKKKRNVLLAGILSLLIFTSVSFFSEYFERRK